MSRLVGKPTISFPNRCDRNRAVQAQKLAREWKFLIKKVEESFYPCSENKGADQLRGTVKLICVFVFAYADCWFSHEAAQITSPHKQGLQNLGQSTQTGVGGGPQNWAIPQARVHSEPIIQEH